MGREPSWGKDMINIGKENAQRSPKDEEHKAASLIPSEDMINLS
jgi:hypothetical protein